MAGDRLTEELRSHEIVARSGGSSARCYFGVAGTGRLVCSPWIHTPLGTESAARLNPLELLMKSNAVLARRSRWLGHRSRALPLC